MLAVLGQVLPVGWLQQSSWVRVVLSQPCLVCSVPQSSLCIILWLLSGWPIQERLEVQAFTCQRLSSCLHSQLYCKIVLTFLLLSYQSSRLTTMGRTRTMNNPCKLLQNQNHQLLNPGQENKFYRLWGSTLESLSNCFRKARCSLCYLSHFTDPGTARSMSNERGAPPWPAEKSRTLQLCTITCAVELSIHLGQKWFINNFCQS